MTRIGWILALAIGLAACTQNPEIEALLGPEPAEAPYPTLLPFDTFPDPAPPEAKASADANADLEARAAALRQRAGGIGR